MQWPKTCVSQKLEKKSRNRVTVLKSSVYRCFFLCFTYKNIKKVKVLKDDYSTKKQLKDRLGLESPKKRPQKQSKSLEQPT